MAHKTFTISNEIIQLETLYEQIEILGEKWELSPKLTMQINLSLEELVSNIIFYGYPDQGHHTLRICLDYHQGIITITTEDDGIPFNPLTISKPNLEVPIEERKIGGLGIHFIQQLMDEVSYERRDNKNLLTMRKKAK